MFKIQYRPQRSTGLVRCLIPFVVLAAVCGCGKSHPYSCVRVSGKVTYEDGSLIPADRIVIGFIPQVPPVDPKTPPKSGRAEVDAKTGKFEYATTYAGSDGIIKGEHKVTIGCFLKEQVAPGLVPDDCTRPDKTPLKVRSGDSPFDIKVPKPH